MKENEMRQGRRFRNHISIILEQTGAVIAAVFVLIVTQLFQSIDELTESDLSFITSKGFLILIGVITLLAVSLTGQVLVWARTYISIEENAIVIEKGRVNKKKNTIGIRNISNINLEQNLIEMLFGTCKVKLDTNSRSTADSTDVKIVLKKSDALWFQQEVSRKMEEACGLTAGNSGTTGTSVYAGDAVHSVYPAMREPADCDVHAGIADILQHGFYSISILSVIIFLLVITGTVISVAEVLGRADMTASLAGAAAGILVAVFIILSTLWDTVKDFVRYYDFRAKRLGDKIYIKYGFFKKVEYTIPVDKIQALKIRQSFLARIGHRYMAEIAAEHFSGQFDAVTFVPVSEKRLRQRGYDQARLLAESACRLWDTRPRRLLRKTVHNPAQSGLKEPAARRANVLGVYEMRPGAEVSGRRVLLIDDVCTTGATLTECSKVLREAGADAVVCACVAHARRERDRR